VGGWVGGLDNIGCGCSIINFKYIIYKSDGSCFLKVDYSVDCGGDEHKFYETYAILVVLVYPISILFMYFVLLYRRRV
jgi:hypothetical protein